MASVSENPEVERFRSFLRIKSTSFEGPVSGSYEESVSWLERYAEEHLQLPTERISPVPNKPILIIKWVGSEPSLPCLVLNSHYDVVPTMDEHWEVDPFAAIYKDGKIYGRGAQDMKCVCIQYLEAVRRLKKQGFQPVRTIHLLFVPDEEIGGTQGMGLFLESLHWASMQPVALVLDEGLANPKNAYSVFYGERIPWWLLVKVEGPTGHGSRFIKNTATSRLVEICNKALEFRAEQEKILGHTGGCSHASAKKLGDVTSINLTMLRSGVTSDGGATYSLNVIPTTAEAGFDVRISPSMHPSEFKSLIDDWCKEEGVEWKCAPWTTCTDEHYLTSIDRDVNPWWGVFLDTMAKRGVDVEPEIFPAGTDSRLIRELGVAALGFSPMRNSPILLHEHNEFIHEYVFMEGIEVYEQLLTALASVEKMPSEEKV